MEYPVFHMLTPFRSHPIIEYNLITFPQKKNLPPQRHDLQFQLLADLFLNGREGAPTKIHRNLRVVVDQDGLLCTQRLKAPRCWWVDGCWWLQPVWHFQGGTGNHKNSAQGAMKVSSSCNWLACAVCATQHQAFERAFFPWTWHGKFSEINIWIVWTANTWCFSRLCSLKIPSSLHTFWTFQVLSVLISNSYTLHR